MKLKSALLIAATMCVFAASCANAALTTLYATDFNSPLYADGGLIGQDSWAITGSSVVNPITVSNTATDGTVGLITTGQDVFHSFTAATIANTSSIFLKADITVTAAQAIGDYFIHLGDGGTSNFFARTYIKTSGAGFSIGAGTSSGAAVTYGSALNFSTLYTILIRYDFVAGTLNDTGALFINPTSADGSLDTAYVAMTTIGIDAGTISSVNLRQGTGSSAPTVTVDNIAVSSVPEPSCALLGTVGLLGLLRRRR